VYTHIKCVALNGNKIKKKVQNVNELHDRILRAEECITNEMLANIWHETEYFFHVHCTINNAHTEIY